MPTLASSPLRTFLLRPLAGSLLVVVCAMPASAQLVAQQGEAPKPFSSKSEAPKPFTAWSNSVHSMRDSLVAAARAQIGTPYVHGGDKPESGFDCSGLVRYVMAGLHIDLPRTAALQARSGLAVKRDEGRLRPGDLLTFGKGTRASHIGIYVGNGRYVHASSAAGRVIESELDRPKSPLIKSWRGVRRVVASDADTTIKRGDS